MTPKLKIAIIEDDQEISHRLKRYIESSDHMECVAIAASVENFLKYIHKFSDLDILLLDIELPGMSGIQAIPKIKSKVPAVNIVMVTSFADDETIFQAIRSGAIGYMLKDFTQFEFQKMLLSVPEGGSPISLSIARKIIDYFSPPKNTFFSSQEENPLTQKEKLVLHNLIQGLTYQEISEQMGVTINSIRYHVKNIYTKLQVNSRSKLADKFKDFFPKNSF
ncbi:MAG: response regulator transcription factor [Saprospiraceae bacterium]